ncbi:galactokinase [Actinoplanes octamycinicus]|uniref:Galactokinase n=1 Tax=Actinoplanes octamycinicus TaxID=135948 RepID=A0A7W7MBB9_9ACTN|nr:hypothetical protein [Actinoplanes octamycinicus]MBB4743958.1 galactokinase [Actinoplanes octamycinicus]GIE58582.1 hypothetical protein Aoc01nite_39840 [Actinoplanes octamycinicus]
MTVSTNTRACLAGEDLDWLGHRSVCVAVDLPTRIRLCHDDVAEDRGVSRTANAVWRFLRQRGDRVPVRRPSVTVDAEAPLASGLSSSSSLIIGLIRAFTAHLGLPISDETLLSWSFDFEYAICHGGGMDQTAIIRGDAVLTGGRDGTPPLLLGHAPFPAEWRLIVVDSALPKSTVGHLAEARRRHAAGDSGLARYVDRADHAAAAAWSAILAEDLPALVSEVDRAHEAMRDVGMSHPVLESLRDLARREAGLSLKITGAGGGGAMVGVCHASQATAAATRIRAALAARYPRAGVLIARAAPGMPLASAEAAPEPAAAG